MATLVITRGYHKNHTKSPGLWSFSRPSGDHPGVNSGDNPKCLGPWGRAPTIPSQIKDFLCTKSKTKWALIGQNFVCVYIYIKYIVYIWYIYIHTIYVYKYKLYKHTCLYRVYKPVFYWHKASSWRPTSPSSSGRRCITTEYRGRGPPCFKLVAVDVATNKCCTKKEIENVFTYILLKTIIQNKIHHFV